MTHDRYQEAYDIIDSNVSICATSVEDAVNDLDSAEDTGEEAFDVLRAVQEAYDIIDSNVSICATSVEDAVNDLDSAEDTGEEAFDVLRAVQTLAGVVA